MNNVAPTVVPVGIDDPMPAIPCDGAAIIPSLASSIELFSDDLPVFHWGMIPDAATIRFV